MKKIKKIFLLVVLFFPVYVFSAEPITLDNKLERYDFGKHIEYYTDLDKSRTIDNITSGNIKWLPCERESINFGFSSEVHWFRFSVNNITDSDIHWYFEISYPLLDYVDFYIPENNGYRVFKTGDHYPFDDRIIKDKNFVFFVMGEPGIKTYYLRVATSSSLNFIPIMWSHLAYLDRSNKEQPVTWIYYGLLIVMVIYNLFIFFSVRERAYIYYSLFITAWILFQLTLNGFAFQYLWPNLIWWGNNSLPFFMCLTQVFNLLFVRHYIEPKKNFPYLDKFMNYFLLIPMSIWCVGSFSGNYRISITVATALTIYYFVSIYVVNCIAAYKGSRPARYFVYGYAFLFVGLTAYTLKTFGVFPSSFFTRWSIQIGVSFLVIHLSLGLADKINIMKNNLEILNKELLDLNASLEDKVKARTEELSAAMNELEAMNDNLLRVNEELEHAGMIQRMDMKMAANVQAAFFPQNPPVSDRYDIAFLFKPKSDVSGDFYDFYTRGDKLDGAGLFDVSGHGISSGLITLIARSIIFRNFYNNENIKLNTIFENINQDLINEIDQVDNYITGILLKFYDDKVDYVNSGHPDLLYRSGNSKNVYLALDKDKKSIKGNFLGISAMQESFRMLTLGLNSGDCLLLYTDCFLESKNQEAHEYGLEGLIQSFKSAPDGNAQEILDHIVKEFHRFIQDESNIDDDLSAVLVKCK